MVEKETIQPTVVHTTVPIHETHHNSAKLHETSVLPTVSIDEFKSKGGVLGGREERYDGFEGEPKNIGGLRTKHLSETTTKKRDSVHGEFAGEEIRVGGVETTSPMGTTTETTTTETRRMI